MSDYVVGSECNLALHESSVSQGNTGGKGSKRGKAKGGGRVGSEEDALKDMPPELVSFARGICDKWSMGDKERFQRLPEHARQAEMVRLMKKYGV